MTIKVDEQNEKTKQNNIVCYITQICSKFHLTHIDMQIKKQKKIRKYHVIEFEMPVAIKLRS